MAETSRTRSDANSPRLIRARAVAAIANLAALISLVAIVCLVMLAAPRAALGQSSQAVVLPADSAAPIKWGSRVIQNWYSQDKLHAFLMIDGFQVEQGSWKLLARDGIIWFDEGAVGADGRKTLGIYAEGEVTIRAGGQATPQKFDSIYITLQTNGEIERRAADKDQDIEKSAEDAPLFLRAKAVRERTFVAAAAGQLPAPLTEADLAVRPAPPELAAQGPADPSPGKPKGLMGQLMPEAEEIYIGPRHYATTAVTTRSLSDDKTQEIIVRTGGASIVYGSTEIKADEAVIWMNSGEVRKRLGPDGKPLGLQPEVYLEGNVVINHNYITMRSNRAYLNLDQHKALMTDTSIRSFSSARDIPVYYYAKEVRQLAERVFTAKQATMTTSEMGHPHWALHGSNFQLVDLTSESAAEGGEPTRRLRFSADNVTSDIRGLPVSWWPRLAGDVEQTSTALRRINLTNSSNRGMGIESEWYLWRILGVKQEPEGFKRTYLHLNFYGERGPYVGVESRYQRENFFGDLITNYIHDTGQDTNSGIDVNPPSNRGRVTWRHRQFLPKDWQATAEVSYLSDPTFLHEWYEREDLEGKDQETLFHLKKQQDNQALTILGKVRINEFLTQTESAPRIEYFRLGQPLWQDRLTYFTQNVLAYEKYNVQAHSQLESSPWTGIADTNHEVDYPFQAGAAKIVPYVDGRGSYFQHSLDRNKARGRAYGAAGTRASWYLWKVYNDVQNKLWGLNRLRHVNTFDADVMQAGTNVGSRKMWPFDEPGSAETQLVNGVDATDIYRLGWRQRWQTHRGLDNRVVDWVTFDLLATWYGDTRRPRVTPDNDNLRNNLQADYSWQISDTVAFVGDSYYCMQNGTLRVLDNGLAVVRSPRFSYYLGHRYIPDSDSSMLTVGLDYVINSKWKFHVFEQYNLMAADNSNTRFVLTRRMASWDMSIAMELDPGNDDKIFMLEFQPVGIPEFTVKQ